MPGPLGLQFSPDRLQLILTVGYDDRPGLTVGDIRLTGVRELGHQRGIGLRRGAGEVVSPGIVHPGGPGADDSRASRSRLAGPPRIDQGDLRPQAARRVGTGTSHDSGAHHD